MRRLAITLLLSTSLYGSHVRALYNSLDPESVAQSLAFYNLYPEEAEGREALMRAGNLIRGGRVDRLVSPVVAETTLTDEEVSLIEELGAHFPNRKLQGYHVKSEAEVLALPSEEIDLGKALLLSQLDGEPDAAEQARRYSAQLDLMALQIQARLPKEATPYQKIRATNRFIFEEMHFKFPPHSVHAQDIDLYTFLPSVMDNHLGVCLGVTALYLAIAQRIDLPLEIITPPGHIYVRYRDGEEIRNIETTARGVHMPCETYLSVGTRSLQERTLKEVIGMTHFNQASTFLHQEKFERTVQAYEKARPYMHDDPMVNELLGFSYLLVDREAEGEALLREIADALPDHAVNKRTLAEDYLAGKVDKEGVKATFMLVDEKRESILKKQKRLAKVVEAHPEFRDGLHALAITWIQLNRKREAMETLLRAHEIDPTDPTTEYYLSVLHGERRDFKSCWKFLQRAEALTAKRNFSPKILQNLRRELTMLCPE